jgi:two-component system, OmpR family, sensor histidine kinase VanS
VKLRTRLILLVSAAVTLAGAAVLAIVLLVLNRQVSSTPLDTFGEAAEEFGLDASDPDRPVPPAIRRRRVAVDQLRTDDGRTFQEVLDDIDEERRDDTTRVLLVSSLVGIAVVGATSIAAGWLVARRILDPVRAVTAGARSAARLDLGHRIALAGPSDEVRELADTFDEMMAKLDASLAAHRRFASDVAHELRNPIAAIRSEAELAMESGLDARTSEVILTEAVRCDELIDRFLTMARIEAPPRLDAPVDLTDLVGDAVARRVEAASAHGVEVRMTLEDAEVRGDEVLLRVLVDNLVGNAITHNEPGGFVDVAVGTVDRTPQVTVSNSGAVLDMAAELVDPFVRGTDDGHGLGLAIARSIAGIHAAELVVAARPGGGLVVTVRFGSRV